jgi:hypothetical protein
VTLFHPRVFRGLSVRLLIKKHDAGLAAERLELIGAKVLRRPSQQIADVIVTDQPTAHAKSNIVSVQQVPWVFWTETRLGAVLDRASPNEIVVADANRKYRPVHQTMTDIPRLHLGAVPRGYGVSPFYPIVDRQREQPAPPKEPLDFAASPPDKAHCEICLINFADAAEHRRSKEHQRRIAAPNYFSEIDAVILQVAQLTLL